MDHYLGRSLYVVQQRGEVVSFQVPDNLRNNIAEFHLDGSVPKCVVLKHPLDVLLLLWIGFGIEDVCLFNLGYRILGSVCALS